MRSFHGRRCGFAFEQSNSRRTEATIVWASDLARFAGIARIRARHVSVQQRRKLHSPANLPPGIPASTFGDRRRGVAHVHPGPLPATPHLRCAAVPNTVRNTYRTGLSATHHSGNGAKVWRRCLHPGPLLATSGARRTGRAVGFRDTWRSSKVKAALVGEIPPIAHRSANRGGDVVASNLSAFLATFGVPTRRWFRTSIAIPTVPA